MFIYSRPFVRKGSVAMSIHASYAGGTATGVSVGGIESASQPAIKRHSPLIVALHRARRDRDERPSFDNRCTRQPIQRDPDVHLNYCEGHIHYLRHLARRRRASNSHSTIRHRIEWHTHSTEYDRLFDVCRCAPMLLALCLTTCFLTIIWCRS